MNLSRATLGLGLLAATITVSACSTTREASSQLSDAGITSKVKAKFAADPEVSNVASIDVDTQEGVVRLSGNVDTQAQKEEAEKLAKQTEGVRYVRNDIDVGGGRSFGRGVDDAVITSKIKAKLTADPSMNPFNIDVDTDKGAVTLTGRVNDTTEKATAERVARDTAGVQSVDNRLLVGDEDASAEAERKVDMDDDRIDEDDLGDDYD